MVDTRSKWIIQILDDETDEFRNTTHDDLGWRHKTEYLTRGSAERAVESLAHSFRINLMMEMKNYAGIHRGRDAQIYHRDMHKVADIKFRYVEDTNTLGE